MYQSARTNWSAAADQSVRIIDPLAIDADLAARWDALTLDASEPNAFAERWCLAPALQLLDPQRRARLIVIEVGGRLIGVAALADARRYGPLPLRHLVNWTHPNHFHGAPLVRAGCEQIFWLALINWCNGLRGAGALLQWSRLTASGALHRALLAIADVQAMPVRAVHSEARALLCSSLSPEDYWEAAVRGKKRKELRRQANRLAEDGAIEQRHWLRGEPIGPWVEVFLKLELGGWKGRAGSALACDPATQAWFRAIMQGACEAGRLDMRMLAQNGRPLAVLINFLCGSGGFSFKTAFDEDYARFSPGVLLQQANLDLLHRTDIHWVDSCAAPGHPMIDSVWRERRELAWVNIPIGGRAQRIQYDALMRTEALWHRLRRRTVAVPADALE